MTQRQILRPPFHDMVPRGQLIKKKKSRTSPHDASSFPLALKIHTPKCRKQQHKSGYNHSRRLSRSTTVARRRPHQLPAPTPRTAPAFLTPTPHQQHQRPTTTTYPMREPTSSRPSSRSSSPWPRSRPASSRRRSRAWHQTSRSRRRRATGHCPSTDSPAARACSSRAPWPTR